jgi:benzoylsuccinyl-CoA thiolase BbsB subunit
MRNVCVLGVGQTVFGKHKDKDVNDLGAAAAMAAFKDCEISPKEVQVGYVGAMYPIPTLGESILRRLGVDKIPIYNMENACSSGNSAIHLLRRDIQIGACEVGIAVGVESISSYNKTHGKGLVGFAEDLEAKLGLTMPTFFGMLCNRLMEERGATIEDICYASVKNHKNGMVNPWSQYKTEVTVEEIMASPMISDPITVLQCCPQSDGGAAIILCSEEYYKKHNKKSNRVPVRIAGSAIQSGGATDSNFDPLALPQLIEGCKAACEMAGVGPEDIDVVELHDAFSGEELAAYEMLGLCKKYEGIEFARSGATAMGGKCPVNPSGGLQSMGHPLGASGVRCIVDIARQLWGEAGAYQVEGAKVGLGEMLGGVLTNLESPVVAGLQVLVK